MTFATPLFLLAVLAGIIPLLLHLIHREKAVEVRFSTLRFLQRSVQRTRRWRFLDHLLLLLLRVAALVLIALGLARPALTSLHHLFGRGSTTAVAIILDNSASMALLDGGQPRFELARHVAEEVLDRLHEGDSVALLLTGGRLEGEQGKLYHTQETVRQLLAQSAVSMERADLATRLHQARALLRDTEATRREIYILTDNQALSWAGLKPPEGEKNTSEIPVVIINLNREPAANVALKSLRLDTPAPAVGVPIQLTVELVNQSITPQQNHLELHVDGSRESISPTLHLPAGGSLKHEFHFTFDRPGLHRGEVRLAEQDGSALDNRLFFALAVDQQIPVAIVKSRRHEIAHLEDTFYLEKALAPAQGESWGLRVASLTPEELATETLSSFAVLYCVNLPALDQPLVERLHEYVRRGGHLVWIVGNNVQPDAYERMNNQAQGQLVPARLAPLRETTATEGAPPPATPRIGSLDRTHPALTPLTEPASLYQSVLVHRSFPLKPEPGAHVLAQLQDGQPLLVERTLGAGSVLLLGTGVQAEWTNLPLKPLFLPLIVRLTFTLAGVASERSQVQAGAPLVVTLPSGDKRGEIEIVRPGGETLRVPADASEGRAFRYSDTHEMGIYLVRLLDPPPLRQFIFAVNGDPEETDPAILPRAELLARFGSDPVLFCDTPETLPETIHTLREGFSLWSWFLWAVLLTLIGEVFLANRLRNKPLVPAPLAPKTLPASSTTPSPTFDFLDGK